MRVFVAGGSGVIGRPLIRQLTEAGHEAIGTTRSSEKAEAVRRAGATPVVVDALDFDALRRAVHDARPDVVMHQLTALPQSYDMRNYDRTIAPTSRLRTEVTPVLIEAAREAGARRFISQSVCFMYGLEGDRIKDEQAPIMARGPAPMVAAAQATGAMEGMVTGAQGLEGVVLRYGQFYGPGTYYARDGAMGREAVRRRFPIVGDGGGMFSFVHVEDAAAATVLALDRGASGIYNVCDDEPAPLREWLPVYARALGAKPPRRAPRWLARLIAGAPAALSATELRGASNAKAKRELGWTPRYPSWREGFAQALA